MAVGHLRTFVLFYRYFQSLYLDKETNCISELLFAETSKNSADFSDLTEFSASSNQTEDVTLTPGKQSCM